MELRISIKHAIAGTAIAAAALGFSANANAAILDCPGNIADNVTGTSNCQYSTTYNHDSVKPPHVVNEEGGFFGITDWTFITKTDLAGDPLSGSWSLASNIWSLYEEIMLIFKDGKGTTLVGYLVDEGVTSGTWTSPFENPPFTSIPNTKAVSYISAYGIPTSVPEPAALAILAAGLLGFGLSRSRAHG